MSDIKPVLRALCEVEHSASYAADIAEQGRDLARLFLNDPAGRRALGVILDLTDWLSTTPTPDTMTDAALRYREGQRSIGHKIAALIAHGLSETKLEVIHE